MKFKKYSGKFKVTLIIILILGMIAVKTVSLPIKDTKESNSYINNIKQAINIAKGNSPRDNNLKHNELKHFSFKNDTLQFRNFNTENNGGFCLGFSRIEKLNYTGQLKNLTFDFGGANTKITDKLNFDELNLNEKTIEKLYKKNTNPYTYVSKNPHYSYDAMQLYMWSNKTEDDFSKYNDEYKVNKVLQ